MNLPVTPDDVARAARAIDGRLIRTPTTASRTLSEITGAEVFIKFENLQFTSSYKERGALNKLLSLDGDARRRGVVACSAGNFAQAVAYHARRLGVSASIVMPVSTPNNKVSRTASGCGLSTPSLASASRLGSRFGAFAMRGPMRESL